VEFLLLRRGLNARIGPTGIPAAFSAKLWSAALAGAALGWTIKLALGVRHPWLAAALILAPYGLTYLGLTYAMGLPESRALARRLRR
jgi:putative peptidoglycan lipid II flippase